MRTPFVLLSLLGVATPVWAETSLYGAANAWAAAHSNDAGTSMHLDADLSHFGFRGTQAISPDVTAEFDARYYADLVDRNNSSFPFLRLGHAGVSGDFGTVRLFGGRTPVSRTQSYLNLMEEDPTDIQAILGGGLQVPGAVLPTGADFDTGLGYTSRPLQGGLSIDGAILPAQDPDGDTGFSMGVNLDQPSFRTSVGFEVNGVADNTQVLRLVGEYDLGSLTLGGLLQLAGNRDQNLEGTSLLAYSRAPIGGLRWPTRLQLLAGYSEQQNDANTIDASQGYASVMGDMAFSDKVSGYGFGEVLVPDDSDNSASRIGVGLKIAY